MLDKFIVPILKRPLKRVAAQLHRRRIAPDTVTIAGFVIGLMAIPAVALGNPMLGLVCLLLNRIADGVDGELARLNTPTDAGGFLDITLDFIFYAAFPLGFAIADPEQNALACAVLICLLYTSPSPRDGLLSRMPSSA